MPYCTKCGNKLEDGDAFCGACGAPAPSVHFVDASDRGDERRNGDTTAPRTDFALGSEPPSAKISNQAKPAERFKLTVDSAPKAKPEFEDDFGSGTTPEPKQDFKPKRSSDPRKKPKAKAMSEEDVDFERDSEARETKLKRCPACGEIVSPNETICPTCAFEIRDVAEGSIALLSKRLDIIESKRPEKKRKEDRSIISATDERKISLIRSWPIPNSKEDLFEFMAMAGGNCIRSGKIGTDRIASEDALSDAWSSKFDQAYAKAKRLFGKTEDFEQFKELKSEVQKKAIFARYRPLLLGLLGIFLYLFIFLFLFPFALKLI